MVINAHCLLCRFKQGRGKTKTRFIPTVHAKEYVIGFSIRDLTLYFVSALNHTVRLRDLLQIDICANVRVLFLQIQVQPHTRSHTVTVRSDMPADSGVCLSL